MTRPKAPASLSLDRAIFFKLVRLVNLTARPFSESIGGVHRLTLNGWRILLVLANHPGVAASEVVALTGLDKMSVSRALTSLVRQGRVVRKGDSADRRRVLLRLSADGERLYERIGTTASEHERSHFHGLGAAKQATLGRMLDRLIEHLAAADEAKTSQRSVD